jgi:signal transduction histidine kinase/DNA-binding response OmpR family regulator
MNRILIVDDREDSRYLLTTLLAGSGYEVEHANNGADALAKARPNPPQLVISDLLMPVMDGYSLLRQWRADTRLRPIPFIVYTATYTDPKDAQLALSLGADAFLLKPMEPDDLVNRIRQVLAAGVDGPAAAGPRPAPGEPVQIPVANPAEEDASNLRLYSEVLIRKLEDKMDQLEQANRTLARDLAERQRTERHVEQLSRVYAVLSAVNCTIVREHDPQAMLAAVCQIAVEKGRFRMAWIGMYQAETKTLQAIASSGVVEGYTELPKFNLRDQANVTGPAAQCALSGQHVVSNHIATDPIFQAWRSEALRRGYQSSASFPLRVGGQLVGVFSLYASGPGFFTEDELRLLDELAMDISFALEISRRGQERQQAEDELRWKTAFLEAQVDSALDGILVVDSQGRKLLQNQRLNELWKIPPQVAANPQNDTQVSFVAHHLKQPQKFAEELAYLNAHPDEVSRDEIELVDGTILDRYSSPVRDKAGKHYGRIWTFRDITQQRKLEAQFRQSQKMEAFGQLAGGVAHDFNNILAVIQLQAEILKSEPNLSLEQLGSIQEITQAAQRATNLTRQLLLFSRRQTMQPRDLNLHDVVANIARMLQRTLGEDIQLQFQYAPEPLLVRADAGMVDQILLNLAVNARDAMPKGGHLTIATSAAEFDDVAATQNQQARPGVFACLSVTDTGSGIPPEILPRIFEPFFTTKEVGKGTGLGLATCFGIVQQHKGWMSVYSELGRGTTFRVYLPRLNRATDKNEPGAALASVHGGTETILLAEDEPALRAVVRTTLSRLGYRVLEAASGVDALAVWRENGAAISLLFTDLVMPGGLTGRELADQLLVQNPKLKVIYTSGYWAETAAHDFVLEEGVNFLSKPIESAKLAQTIRNRLDQT